MTAIRTVIPRGAPIPADVIVVSDMEGDTWMLEDIGWRHFYATRLGVGGIPSQSLSNAWGPLMVRAGSAEVEKLNPVQARSGSGTPLWIHGCGYFGHAPEMPASDWCPGCGGRTPSPWRPLLVVEPAPCIVAEIWRSMTQTEREHVAEIPRYAALAEALDREAGLS